MTNNKNEQEEKCITCKGYSYFKALTINADVPIEEAFHVASEYMIEVVMDELEELEMETYTVGLERGFDEGYISALRGISKLTESAIKDIEMLDDEREVCSCDTAEEMQECTIDCKCDCGCEDDY